MLAGPWLFLCFHPSYHSLVELCCPQVGGHSWQWRGNGWAWEGGMEPWTLFRADGVPNLQFCRKVLWQCSNMPAWDR